ncbi:MAG: hypothetical protein Q4D89_03590 [Arachnia propionica]|uniref:hypothetical protein n=1 Tax=Arachnia propionica TaxID=1750 RepID=UPI0026FC8A1D|nr:hypothetical protein [Arachnia propionica]
MRAVRTQFDAGEFRGAVATPTCCSCCCCCCCVTTAATASIVGAGAAVVAGRRRPMSAVRRAAAVFLGVIAPWLVILPICVAFTFRLPTSIGFLELLGLGLVLICVGYLILPLLLGRRHPMRAGLAALLSVLVLGFVEAFVMFHVLASFATGDLPHGWPVFYGYVLLAVVLAIVLGRGLIVNRSSANSRTFVEELAGVSPEPPHTEQPASDE